MNPLSKKIDFSVSLLIPVYNCEKTIIGELRSCNNILKNICSDYEIVVSDDFSTDKTPKILKENFGNNKNFRLIFQKKNLGIGKNFKFLYQSARKDFLITYAPDGDYKSGDIKKMLLLCQKQKGDLVIGKRNKKGGYTLYRKIISSLYRLFPLILFGIDTIDAGSIKLIRRNLFKEKLLSTSPFIEAEIIIRASRMGYKILVCSISYGKPEKISGAAGKFYLALDAFRELLVFRLRG